MAIHEFVSKVTADEARLANDPRWRIVEHNSCWGEKSTDIVHSYNCPHRKSEKNALIPIDEQCASTIDINKCHLRGPFYERVGYEGAVLATYERNGYDDSDFYAVVYDTVTEKVVHKQFGTTRAWTYANSATVDATEEIKTLVRMYEMREYAYQSCRDRQIKIMTPKFGDQVTIVSGKHKNTTGIYSWCAPDKFKARSSTRPPFVAGVDVPEGKRLFVPLSTIRLTHPQKTLEGYEIPWSYMHSLGGNLLPLEINMLGPSYLRDAIVKLDTKESWDAALQSSIHADGR